jgi:hypothetical protein
MSAPTQARLSGDPGGAPRMSALPEVGRTSPRSIRKVVVLPAPFGPRNPYTSPRRTQSDSLSTATIRPS